MQWRTCLVLLSTGLCILLGGFSYEVIFAGIPYQDPTPAMQAQYLHHSRIARAIETVGLLTWALGVINVVLSWVHKSVSSPPCNSADGANITGSAEQHRCSTRVDGRTEA